MDVKGQMSFFLFGWVEGCGESGIGGGGEGNHRGKDKGEI